MTTGNRVTGRVALALSQQFAVTLHKFADPVSGADDDMDLESEIIRECLQADPQLLWVDRHEAARAVAAATLIDCASDSLYVIASQAVCDADNAHDVRRIVADVCRIYREATEEAQNER